MSKTISSEGALKFSEFPIGLRFRYVHQGRWDRSCWLKLSATTYGNPVTAAVNGGSDRPMEGDPLVLACPDLGCIPPSQTSPLRGNQS